MSNNSTHTSGPSVKFNTGFAQRFIFNAPKGPLMAVLLSGSLMLWMSLGPAPVDDQNTSTEKLATSAVQSVRTIMSTSYESRRLITAEGDTSAYRRGNVSPRVSGIVSDILHTKGEPIEEGQAIAIIDVPGFSAMEAEAKARLDEAQRSYNNAKTLADRGLASTDRLVGATTDLAAANSQWASIQEQRADMTLSAPFTGVLDSLDLEVGDNISPGTAVAEVLDLSSLTIKASIPQAQIASLSIGKQVTVSLVTGQTAQGHITYISSQADRQTRSFPIEVEIRNTDGDLKAGVSASIQMYGEETMTHAVPAAYLSLDSDGSLIVKTINDGHVASHTVDVVSSGLEEVLVTGLPDEVEIITVGQGFVQVGDAVRAERVQ